MRRKSMPVLSVPGALVGGDEVTMAVFHELSRAEGPSQQGRKTSAGGGLRTRGQTGLAARVERGTDRPDSEIPAKSAGNSCQGCQSPMRRKSMPVLSVPGALVGGDEVTMAVFHELSRAEGPSQQTTKGAPSVPLRSDAQGGALCRWFGFGGGRRVHGFVARSGVEIAVAGGAVGAVPLGEGLPYDTVHGSPIPRDQLQPLPRTLWREVNPAEEDARHEMADLVGDRFIGDGIEGSLCCLLYTSDAA